MEGVQMLAYCGGTFDLLHPGHVRMLKWAKESFGHVIVAVNTDDFVTRYKAKPAQTLHERMEMLEACKYVDEVIVYNTEAELYALLQKLNPDVRFIGADWKGKEFTGHDLPIPVIFNSRDHEYSSSDLRKRIYEAEKQRN